VDCGGLVGERDQIDPGPDARGQARPRPQTYPDVRFVIVRTAAPLRRLVPPENVRRDRRDHLNPTAAAARPDAWNAGAVSAIVAAATTGADAMPTNRRFFLTAIAGLLGVPAGARFSSAQIANMSGVTAFAFHFAGLKGGDIQLAEHAGRPILIVNTASLCGYTPQYAGLQELWTRYRDRGLLIVGVPSNDFGGQEPGDAGDISATAEQQYHASFPITAKADVSGDGAHPFYKWAAAQRPLDRPRWNFHKYLIGRNGLIAASFPSAIEPTDPRMIAAIEKELPPPASN